MLRYLSFTCILVGVLCSTNNNQLEDKADQLIAEESKRYFQAVPYTTAKASSSPITTVDATKDLYKKSASEYWPQNEMSPMSNHIAAEPMIQQDYGQYGHAGGAQETDYMVTPFTHGYVKGREINISPEHKPITLHYRTHAQPIVVHQTRLPGPKPEVKHTTSHEEPQRVVHEVIRPIIQEVHEIIQPYRRVVQQVQPVIEEVRTIIAKDAGKGAGSGSGSMMIQNAGSSYGNGGGSMQKTSQIYHASASNELMRHIQKQPINSHHQGTFRKAALFDGDDDNMMPLAANNNHQMQNNQQNNQRIIRSRVFLTPKGIPVYQSNYRAPLYL